MCACPVWLVGNDELCFLQSMTSVVNDSVAEVLAAQKVVDEEAKRLQAYTAKFAKQVGSIGFALARSRSQSTNNGLQTTQWVTMLNTFNQALKELGDFQNWALAVECDMQVIATTLVCGDACHGLRCGAYWSC